MRTRKRIFGKVFALHGLKLDTYRRLEAELSQYPDAGSDKVDIEVFLGDLGQSRMVELEERGSTSEIAAPLVCDYGFCKVKFVTDDEGELRKIYFGLNRRSAMAGLAEKWLRYDFATAEQRIGEIFSELVLVPSVFFDTGKFLLHAATVQPPGSNEAIIIGGLGGGGKTSLELELCRKRGYAFVSDDIAPVSAGGMVYPNLCFPKVYGYNLGGAPELKSILFEGRGFLDKAHWAVRSQMLGPASVRRRMSCDRMFRKYASLPLHIKAYYLIIRAPVESLSVQQLEPRLASEASVLVMDSEYSTFFNHILRHEYNSALRRTVPAIQKAAVLENWARLSADMLAGMRNYLLIVPDDIPHPAYVAEAANIIERT